MPGVAGRSGRRGKTVAQHKREGTFDASRHSGYANPEPPAGVPDCPEGLEGLARAEWDRMIVRLEACQVLTKVDDAVLEQWSKLYAETEALASDLDAERATLAVLEDNLGTVEKDDTMALLMEIGKSRARISAYPTKVRQARVALSKLLTEFGLTPASRGRVKIIGGEGAKKASSPLGKLQAQARALRAV